MATQVRSTDTEQRGGGIPWRIVIPAVLLLVVLAVVVVALLNWGTILAAGESVLTFIFNYDRIDSQNVIMCRENATCSTVQAFVFGGLVLFIVVTGFAYTTLLERRFIAALQHRIGPNRVGPGGFLQPAADGVKLIFKEDITPVGANRPVYMLAPVLKAVPTLIVIAVIPLGPDILVPWFDGNVYQVPLSLADPNVGVLWLLAITSLGTYGVTLAGWASNNKYALLGGMRASAQMISYELSMGLAMIVPILIAGSMSVGDIINAQAAPPILGWFVFQNPLAAGILMIALLAEVNRSPFDLPEAEQELTAGFMTEYSGMKFALFMMAEYLGMIAVSMIAASMFFGGYHLVLVDGAPALGPLVMILKVVLFLMGMIWVRATMPRIRYDRLMVLGWKVLLPLSLLAVAWTSVAVVIGDVFQDPLVYGLISGVMFVVVVAGGLFFLRGPQEKKLESAEPEIDADRAITGERSGLGYVVLQIVGGLLAVPFVLYNGALNLLEKVEKLGAADEAPAVSGQDSTALTTTDKSGAD